MFDMQRDEEAKCAGSNQECDETIKCENYENCKLFGSTLLRFETMHSKEEMSKCYKNVIAAEPDEILQREAFRSTCLQYREARVNAYDLDSSTACTDNCVRGFCQFEDINRYEDT